MPSLGWLGVLIVVGGIAMIAVDRLARRFLPLTALLRMTLIFPDQAPSRFSLAIRSGTTKQLERRLEHVREFGLGDTEAEAAETLLELAAALRQHDRFTRGHGERVRAYAALIGEEMGLGPVEISKLQWAGLIHDVGKLAVPAEVLNKPGRLTPGEYDLIKTHPAEGMAMIGSLTGWLGDWALAVGEHHERWDGKGYPTGLAGHDISLAGRIVAVADTFDVITATRSYKPSQSPQWARRELATNAGTQFDPEVVRAFLNVSIGKLRGVMWPLSWIAHIPFLGSTVTAPATGLAAATVAVIGSSITGGGLGSGVPPEIDPIERGPVASVPAHEVELGTPTTTMLVVPAPAARSGIVDAAAGPPGDEPRRPDGAGPVVLVVTTTTSPGDADAVAPVIVTIPPATATGSTVPDATPTTVGVTPTASPKVVTPTTPMPTSPIPTTAVSNTVPAATAPSTLPATTAPTTLPATTAPPTTSTAKTCAGVRSGATDLSGADLSGCDLSGLTLTGVDLSGADLSGANLSDTRLTRFDLDGADLTGANLDGAVLTRGTMRGTDGTGLIAHDIQMDGVDLTDADLTGAAFDGGRFVAVSFVSVRARGADFSFATFDAVSFVNAELHGSSFDRAVMTDVDLSGAIARGASFRQIEAPGTNWANADLRDADLSGANLSGSNLDGADVRGVDFGDTDLRAAVGLPYRAGAARYRDTLCPDGAVRSSTCWA